MLLTGLAGVTTLLAVVLTIMTAYLVLLSIAAVCAPRTSPPPAEQLRRFAMLIPAHDEAALIERLLASVQAMDYPSDAYDVCVVADNCTDATATLARQMGAHVFERFDTSKQAKGYALSWLLEQLRAQNREYDAFVVLDADSTVARNFLRSMNARLEQGAQAIQAYYSVENAKDSSLTGLRYAALAAVHFLRPLGRTAFGFSCGLKGNGMCFTSELMERFGWSWYTLAEDVEFYLALARSNIRVDFAWETCVRADMPTTLTQAASQNSRWEAGRLQLVRRHVPKLLVNGIASGNLMQMDAALEQLIPPLSLPFAVSVLVTSAGLALGVGGLTLAGVVNLVGQSAYVLTALVLVRAPRSAYLSLMTAPAYIAWKLGLYAQAVVGSTGAVWVRTSRATPRTRS